MLDPVSENEETLDCNTSIKYIQSWFTRARRSRIKDCVSKASCSIACPTYSGTRESDLASSGHLGMPIFIWG